jgi:hypothetical protein
VATVELGRVSQQHEVTLRTSIGEDDLAEETRERLTHAARIMSVRP